MNREQAAAFINAVNTISPFVPPIHFHRIVGSPITELIAAVANGAAIVDVEAVERTEPAKDE